MTTKLAVSLPDRLVAEAKRAVQAGRADSVSAYVARAMERQVKTDTLAELLDELDRLHGRPGEQDFEWADRILGAA